MPDVRHVVPDPSEGSGNKYKVADVGTLIVGAAHSSVNTGLVFSNAEAEPIVTIRFNGTVEINPKYTVDEAALAFWDAVRRMHPVQQAINNELAMAKGKHDD